MVKGVFSLSISFKDLGGGSLVTGIYGPPRTKGGSNFLNELGELFGQCGSNWCVASDFNITYFQGEKFPQG